MPNFVALVFLRAEKIWPPIDILNRGITVFKELLTMPTLSLIIGDPAKIIMIFLNIPLPLFTVN